MHECQNAQMLQVVFAFCFSSWESKSIPMFVNVSRNAYAQVQAREILRIYSDMTSQNATFQRQLLYSLMRQKESSLDQMISRYHGPRCDWDHTRVKPWEQRPHLFSV